MKKRISVLLLLLPAIVSCKKENTVHIAEDNGCIERKNVNVSDHSGYTINNIVIAVINDLFQNNGINHAAYRYVYYSHDSVQTFFPPYVKYDDKIVRVREFTKGLEILNSETVFEFKNNILNFRVGNSTGGTPLNSMPTLNARQIRTLFLGNMEQFDHNASQYKDSCFSAEFGYYNLNAGTGEPAERLVKAWKITQKNRIYPFEVPIAYYEDNDGKLISYFNGIETFH